MSWSNKDTLEFLELYKNEPCIWNPRHKMHKNKNAKSDAWNKIQKTFSLSCTVEELKKKKESLMTTFRSHLNKKRASIKANVPPEEVYRINWFAYSMMESFLAPIYQCKEIIDTEMLETETTGRQVEVEYSSDDSTNQSTSSSRHLSSDLRKQQLQQVTEMKRKMDETFSMVQTVTEASKGNEDPHECDLYGQLLAKRLKRFDENVRDSIMHQIDNIMYQAKLKHVNSVTRSS